MVQWMVGKVRWFVGWEGQVRWLMANPLPPACEQNHKTLPSLVLRTWYVIKAGEEMRLGKMFADHHCRGQSVHTEKVKIHGKLQQFYSIFACHKKIRTLFGQFVKSLAVHGKSRIPHVHIFCTLRKCIRASLFAASRNPLKVISLITEI